MLHLISDGSGTPKPQNLTRGFFTNPNPKKNFQTPKNPTKTWKNFQNPNPTFGNPTHHYISLQIFYDAAGFQNELKFGKSFIL